MAIGAGLTAAALAAAKLGGASALTKGALLTGAGTAIGALPDIIPSKYERDQKKRLREMQRKQEMGALGLTERERAAIESQMRGARQQAQQFAQAERARLTQPTAQPQMALLGQQMQDESRQRLEADLASQILGMDLTRKAQQEQEIKDLEAAQAQYRRARAEGLTAPFQSAAETYVGQLGMERLLGQLSQMETQQAMKNAQAGEVGKALATAITTKPPAEQAQILESQYNLTPEESSIIISSATQAAQNYTPFSLPPLPNAFNMEEDAAPTMMTKEQQDKVENYLKDFYFGRQ
tara:strand:- start:6235 stop:7116 length:882 start_codon:yes stop_codon:yes gene_type:complete